jgi:hypothetical protein
VSVATHNLSTAFNSYWFQHCPALALYKACQGRHRAALSEGCCSPFRTWYATGSPRSYQSLCCHGVPCFRHHLVSIQCRRRSILLTLPREGTHAKHHYLICGVQGDFTKSLVNNPPTKIWTRQLKVIRLPGYSYDVIAYPFSKFAGVSNTSTLYKRGIRICTGTGLGAALSTCIQSPDWLVLLPFRIVP